MTAQSATAMQPVEGPVPVRHSSAHPMEQFDKIYESIAQRAFDLFRGNGQRFGHDLDDWLRAEAELLHPVHLDVTQSDGNFTVLAEVPGFSAKDMEIKVEPRRLSISGRRQRKEENHVRKIHSEWCADQILRVVDLPADVDTAKVSATLKDGILAIDLPKAAHARAQRIEPKSV
jgi:HSP20 family protein